MRVFRLVLLGLVAYVIALIILFPAAPVVDRLRPQLGLVELAGVDGKVVAGEVASVRYTDDLLPLEFRNVGWQLSPAKLLQGAAAEVRYDGYGGSGEGTVLRAWNGDIEVDAFEFSAAATALEPLLPVPIATFGGKIVGSIDRLVLEKQLLQRLEAALTWSEASIETSATGIPFRAALGVLEIDVRPDASGSHVADIAARGGDVEVQGSVTVALNGDYSSDLVLTPGPSASPALLDNLQRVGRPDADGRYRIRQQGNFNRLM